MEQIHLVFFVLIWLFSDFALLVVSLPIGVLDTKLKVEDKLEQSEAHVDVVPAGNYNERNRSDAGRYAPFDGPETSTPKSPLGLRLFPKFQNFKDIIKETKKPVVNRPSPVQFYPKPQENKAPAGGGGGGKGADGADGKDGKEDGDSGIGGIIPPRPPTERTISLPKFKTDYLGNWVYNPWGVTFGVVYRNTWMRYDQGWNIGDNRNRMFFDPDKLSTPKVCVRGSTIYNTPVVMEYVRKPFYRFTPEKLPVFVKLRMQIYKDGNSEECHTRDQIHWRTFTECTLMRNMRMDYLVPRYPLLQTGEADYLEDYDLGF